MTIINIIEAQSRTEAVHLMQQISKQGYACMLVKMAQNDYIINVYNKEAA